MEIHQNYIIKQVIGHGASCTVRRAIRKDTGQSFAIKIYENQLLRAKNQIDILIRLDHPSIVNIYEIFEQENTMILVLQYMEGGQLYSQIGQRQKFTEAQVRYFIKQRREYMKIIIDAVRYCHEMNIVHRDIKPQNLLLTSSEPDGILKLADFGISKILSDQMLTTNCGTPVYMAPQIWKGVEYNHKVDIWSIGVVMYYLYTISQNRLSGTHPFDGDSDKIGAEIMNSELTFPDDVWRPISSRAINLLRQLLAKDPNQRPEAKDIENHIWLTYIEPIPKKIEDIQEINLYKTIHKVKRFIYKDKLKKTNKKMKDLMDHESLSKTRLHFLTYESEELYEQSQPTQIQEERQYIQQE